MGCEVGVHAECEKYRIFHSKTLNWSPGAKTEPPQQGFSYNSRLTLEIRRTYCATNTEDELSWLASDTYPCGW